MPTLRFISGSGSGSTVAQGVVGQIAALNQAIANLNNLTSSLAPIVPQKSISFYLNGNFVTVDNPDPDMTLLTYLRNYTHFVGTKQGCTQGGCGICTVMLSFKDVDDTPKNISVTSCLVKLVNCNNLAITTIEGLGNLNDLHPIQNYFYKIGAYQCGYCTSGQIMNMYTAFQSYAGQSNNRMTPSWSQVEQIMGGNLCRCTGYRPITEVFKTLLVTDATGASSPYINQSDSTQVSEYQALWNKWHSGSVPAVRQLAVYNQTGTDTYNCNSYLAQAVTEGRTSLVQVPTVDCEFTAAAGFNHYNLSSFASVANVVKTVSDLSTISIVQGQSSYGVPGYRRNTNQTVVINVANIPELHTFSATGSTGAAEITIGSGLTISEVYDKLSSQSHRVFTTFAPYILNIAGWQVRNFGSWVGGMMMAKKQGFTSDITLCLLALGATIHYKTIDGSGNIGTGSTSISNFLSSNFSLSNSVVIVTSATISVNANQYLKVYRQGARASNAHAEVHMAFSLDIDGSNNIDNSKIFVGALGYTGATGSGVASYQEFTAGETYLNATTTSAMTYQGLVDAARNTAWDIHIDIIAPNHTEALQITYKKELIYGFCVQFIDEIQGNSLNTTFTKKTIFGTQEYGTPEGTFDNIYDYVIDPNSVYIKKYKPPHPEKAVGQTVYATDLSVNDALWTAPIICNKSLAGKIDFTANPADLFGRPYMHATIDFTDVNGILKGIEIAETMPGVKLILSWLDYKPNTQNAGKSQFTAGGAFEESSAALFSTLYAGLYTTPPAGPFAGINLAQDQFISTLGSTNSSWLVRPFSNKVWWYGQMIGIVVAETQALAISASRVISSYITFVTPTTPGNPVVTVDTSNLANNVPYGRESLQMLGFDNPGWGNFDGTFSTPSASVIAYYSTGSTGSGIGNFDVVYGTGAGSTGTLPPGTYRMTGTTYMGSIDHFPMERHAVTVYPDRENKFNVYLSSQAPVVNALHMDDMFTFGTGSFGGLNVYYSNSGPAREADGTLVYDPSQYNYKTAQVGGAFGMKFYGSHVHIATALAAKRLNRPVKSQWIYSDDVMNNGGSQAQHLLYQMAFDANGKIMAMSQDRYVNLGSFNESTLAIAYGDNDTARVAKSLLNFGAFKSRVSLVKTNKPPAGATRSYGQSQGTWSANIVTQNVSHFLATGSTGSSAMYTGPTQFDVLVRNLITPSSPFVNVNGEILTNLGEVQVASQLESDGFQNDGYQYRSEPSHEAQLRAIDRKVYNLFYTSGTGIYGSLEYNVSNPTGGTGAYLTVAYDNTALRYPSIKQLELDVKRFNAKPENKYVKQGVAVGASTYLMTQGWNPSAEVKMQIDTADGKIKLITAYTDGGASADNRLLMSVADSMLLDPSNFKVINGEDPVSGGLTNAGSQDSVGLMKAGFAATLDFLKKCMDAIYEDLTYAQGVPQFYGLINPFPLAGNLDAVPFTGPTVTYPSGLTIPTQGNPVPSAADLAWVKDGYGAFLSTGALNSVEAYNEQINLMLLTLIRYVNQQYTQQYGYPAGLFNILTYADWNNYPRAVKAAYMAGYWSYIKGGMIGGAPNVLNLSYVYQNPTVGNGGPLRYPTNQGVSTLFFGATIRKITGIGRTYGSNYNAYYNCIANNRIDSCALALVEVNTLTGEYKEKEAIVSMDLGHSSEPITDIGQLEGAYAFGKGYFLREDRYYNETSGELQNSDTWDYKPLYSADTPERLSAICLNYTGSINGPGDLPVVSFLLPNGQTVAYPQPKYPGMPNKSKAIGEVTTGLGVVPFMAVREAIANYRLQNDIDNNTANPATRNAWLDTVATAPITKDKVKNACPLPTTL